MLSCAVLWCQVCAVLPARAPTAAAGALLIRPQGGVDVVYQIWFAVLYAVLGNCYVEMMCCASLLLWSHCTVVWCQVDVVLLS
jgi:hypothetical protein